MTLQDLALGSVYLTMLIWIYEELALKNETASQSQVQGSVLYDQLDMTKWYQTKFRDVEFLSSLS